VKNKLYKELAATIQARENCKQSNNIEWFNKHTDKINSLITNQLPHGSGLDTEWAIDFDKSHGNKITLSTSYHAMDENGYYDGWIDFTVIVLPSLSFDFTIHIRGNFGKYQDIKDYLYDILNESFSQEIES
jgi:hypothetical protein